MGASNLLLVGAPTVAKQPELEDKQRHARKEARAFRTVLILEALLFQKPLFRFHKPELEDKHSHARKEARKVDILDG